MNKIKEITNGSTVALYVSLHNVNISMSTNQTEYLATMLKDTNGDMISARLWKIEEDQRVFLKEGELCYVEGKASEYKGKLQLVINTIRPINESDGINVDSFYERSKISAEQLKDEIKEFLGGIDNPVIKKIVFDLLGEYKDEYFIYPAAKSMHHAFVSGLAEHVLGMLKLGDAICTIHPTLNRSLIYAGILLHDICKIDEFSNHYAPQYTIKGTLLGHISMVNSKIERIALENGFSLDDESVILLQHMVLAHHGKQEYGSPQPPHILEAEVLSYIDNIDSKINMIGKELEKTKDGEFTKRMFALDNRMFYKHKL